MKNKKKIAVLFGGRSSEHEISLQSAYSVIKHMDGQRYEPVMIGITREGKWYLYRGSIERIAKGTWHLDQGCVPAIISPDRTEGGIRYEEGGEYRLIKLDAAFPILHGKSGEDGTVQGLLELAGIPVIGCDTAASAVCMDKDLSHRIVSAAGVRVPTSLVLTSREQGQTQQQALLWARNTGYPLFVKPASEGSSVGMSKVFKDGELLDALDTAFQYDKKVILEETIEGFEVGCAVLGNRDLILGAVDEIDVPGGFFDFKEKYTQKKSHIYVPARIPEQKAREVQATAKLIYKTLGCKGFARVDLFLTPDGGIVFNEVNTIPGFTDHSRYPNMLKSIGLSYDEIVEQLIETEVGHEKRDCQAAVQ